MYTRSEGQKGEENTYLFHFSLLLVTAKCKRDLALQAIEDRCGAVMGVKIMNDNVLYSSIYMHNGSGY